MEQLNLQKEGAEVQSSSSSCDFLWSSYEQKLLVVKETLIYKGFVIHSTDI